MDDLDDIEQLRMAALLTLHQKKPEAPAGNIYPDHHHHSHHHQLALGRPSFDEPISAYQTHSVQLSPRSAAFVESNITILKRRKEGLDGDRWSRSPSPPPPKFKPLKRKSHSPITRRNGASPDRKYAKRVSRSPTNVRSQHRSGHRTSPVRNRSREKEREREREKGRDRDRERDRDRVDRRRNNSNSRIEHKRVDRENRSRHRTRSKSPVRRNSPKPRRRSVDRRPSDEQVREDNNRRDRDEARKEKEESVPKEKPVVVEKMEEENSSDTANSKTEENDDSSDSSDSDTSPSEALDLFASEDEESENEGRFKCSSKPSEKEKSSFSSKGGNKADLINTVLPDGDSKGDGRFGDRGPRRYPRGDGHRRERGGFKSSFREVDNGSAADKHQRRNGDQRRDREERRGSGGRRTHSDKVLFLERALTTLISPLFKRLGSSSGARVGGHLLWTVAV